MKVYPTKWYDAGDDGAEDLADEINKFIIKKSARVLDIKYVVDPNPMADVGGTTIAAFIHYEDSAPSSIDVVPQEETEELEEES